MHDASAVSIRREDVEVRTADGFTLRGKRTFGPGRPKATAVLASGCGEPSSPTEALVQALAASRFAVWSVDRRDHAVEPTFADRADDLGLVVERARNELPGRPCYLIGRSCGGAVALTWTFDHQDEIDGIALLAPALRVQAGVIESGNSRVPAAADRAPQSGVRGYLSGLRSRIGGAGSATSDARSANDLGFREGTIASINDAGRAALARARELRIPILTMHGDADELFDPAASMELYRAVGVRGNADNSLITWPGMKHELLNDEEAEQVIGVVMGWLNGHYTEWRKANPSGIGPDGDR